MVSVVGGDAYRVSDDAPPTRGLAVGAVAVSTRVPPRGLLRRVHVCLWQLVNQVKIACNCFDGLHFIAEVTRNSPSRAGDGVRRAATVSQWGLRGWRGLENLPVA